MSATHFTEINADDLKPLQEARQDREEIKRLREALTNARRSMICSVTGIADGITIHQVREWIAQADSALGREVEASLHGPTDDSISCGYFTGTTTPPGCQRLMARVAELRAVQEAAKSLADFVIKSVNVGPLTKGPGQEAKRWKRLHEALADFEKGMKS